jgi:hypothetical protein
MKYSARNRNIGMALALLFFTLNSFAEFRAKPMRSVISEKKSENLFSQGSPFERSENGTLRNGGIDVEDDDEPEVPFGPSSPIGDSLPFLLGIAVIYGAFLFNKRLSPKV